MSASEEESFVVLGSHSMTSMASYEKISLPNQLEQNEKESTLVSNSLKEPMEGFSGETITIEMKGMSVGEMLASISEKHEARLSNLGNNPSAGVGVKEELPAPQKEVVVQTSEEKDTAFNTSIYSQKSCNASLDPVISTNFMSEYVEMKDKLTEGNALLLKCHETIATLRDENEKLKHEIEVKVKIDEEQKTKDQIESVQSVPAALTSIENTSEELKNEQQQSIDKENVSNIQESLNSSNNITKFISLSSHQHLIEEFEKKISTLVAENIYLRQEVEIFSRDLGILKKDQENVSNENEKLRSELVELKSKYDEAESKRCKEPGIAEIITFGSTT